MAGEIRVLIANDQLEICRLWQHIVGRQADMVCVGIAGGGAEAIKMAHATAPDVVVIDVMMPDINGYQAMRAILSQAPHIKMIVYSAYQGKAEQAYACGADEFMLMPIMPDQLLNTIRSVVAST